MRSVRLNVQTWMLINHFVWTNFYMMHVNNSMNCIWILWIDINQKYTLKWVSLKVKLDSIIKKKTSIYTEWIYRRFYTQNNLYLKEFAKWIKQVFLVYWARLSGAVSRIPNHSDFIFLSIDIHNQAMSIRSILFYSHLIFSFSNSQDYPILYLNSISF